jgi:hypothetical protein
MTDDKALRIVGVAIILCLPGLVGCGSEGAEYVPVSGVVTLDGKPLAGAGVLFEPKRNAEQQARGSSGKTDGSGRFQLEAAKRGVVGAAPGLHTVQIFPPEGHPPLNQNDLTFTVPEDGTDQANFNLSSN